MKAKNEKNNFIDILDTMFVISTEAYEGEGEDSFCCSCSQNMALSAVFDGCGGLGSRQYKHYENHTGAYIASRLASGAVYDWFQSEKRKGITDFSSSELKEKLLKALKVGEEKGGEALKLRGAMVRDFPTTAAIMLAGKKEGKIIVEAMWAGDSRVYFLDHNGLSAFSKDDTESDDAFEDLKNDPVQTNVLSSDGNFIVHDKKAYVKGPLIAIASTDGYFGYWPTPMHFEYFLLDTLERAESLSEWKQNLRIEIQEVTGDDATMAVMLFFFGTYKKLKQNFHGRYIYLKEHYIDPLSDSYEEGKAIGLWQEYRTIYERYMK